MILEIMENFSEATRNTISKIKDKKGKRKMPENLVSITFHDHTSPGYEWLLPTWVAEERRLKRHMKSDRVYKYFYDPEGNLYKSVGEVKAAWENSGLIAID